MRTSQDTRTRVIVNGKNADDPGLRESLTWAQQQGHPIEVRVTQDEGDAARFAAGEPGHPCDVVVAVGGDGTVNEVLNGILRAETGTPPAMAIVPLGTANDFARSCAIPQDHPADALRLAWQGVPRWIDVDGEPIYGDAFDFRILQRRLKIMLPPETPLSWQ